MGNQQPPNHVPWPNSRSLPPLPQSLPPSTQSSTSPRQKAQSTMNISNLLIQPNAPPSEYSIIVRQQPSAARSSGYLQRDRRVIDPPPIVQLTIHNTSFSPDERARQMRHHQFSLVYCSIWDERGVEDMSIITKDGYRPQRRLVGTLLASPFVGLDDKDEEGCFFCFPDLSCCTPGSFRLKFALVMLDPTRMRASSAIAATAMSDPFQVYTPKTFPGMKPHTPLTKRLKEQGL